MENVEWERLKDRGEVKGWRLCKCRIENAKCRMEKIKTTD
jgi:hypothetical protein